MRAISHRLPAAFRASGMLPRSQKLAYGLGDVPASSVSTVLGFYQNYFLLTVACLPPQQVALFQARRRREERRAPSLFPSLSMDPSLCWASALTEPQKGRREAFKRAADSRVGLSENCGSDSPLKPSS